MKRLAVLLFVLSPLPALAWSGYTHRLIAEESLIEVAAEWRLNRPVERTSFEQFLKKFSQIHPQVQTREDFARWLKINPDSPFDRPSRSEEFKKTSTPLEILTLYSARADDGRDLNLSYDKGEQLWFGSGTKTGSQAFRHMEKPPFHPLHPLNTLGFPLGSIGQASQRAQIYFDLAVDAYHVDEPYWAWNFLGVGLHYIQDLGQPYHTAQLLAPLAFNGFKAYFQWGRKNNVGWIPIVTRVVSNAHHYFEGYTDTFLGRAEGFGPAWKKKLHSRQTLPGISSVQALAKQVRDHANTLAFATIQATFRVTGKNLLTPHFYDPGTVEAGPEDPLPYLTTDQPDRMEGAGQISRIMLAVLAQQGMAVRTAVKAFLTAVKEEK